MVTCESANVKVIGVNGNFDDCQKMLKNLSLHYLAAKIDEITNKLTATKKRGGKKKVPAIKVSARTDRAPQRRYTGRE